MKIITLAGGVGGAKLAEGLASIYSPDDLTIVVNTGDDFIHYGLKICTDIDTVCYTLAGLASPDTGWGRKNESWAMMDNLKALGGPDWFSLGDQDTATHLERTRLLSEGWTLTQVTRYFCSRWGIMHSVFPMTDQVVTTFIQTAEHKSLEFQEYFVHQHWLPVVKKVTFAGSELAVPPPGVLEGITEADLVIICPSNPLLSIDPILSIPGIRDQILKKPVIAVSPIVGGKAVKGPLGKMITELYDVEPSAVWVADHYKQTLRLDGFMLDRMDMHEVEMVTRKGIICKPGNTLMTTKQDRIRLAQDVIKLGQTILERN